MQFGCLLSKPIQRLQLTLQISIGWLYVISLVIPLALKGILPIGIVCIGKIPLRAKGITDEITYNHPIDICSERDANFKVKSSLFLNWHH